MEYITVGLVSLLQARKRNCSGMKFHCSIFILLMLLRIHVTVYYIYTFCRHLYNIDDLNTNNHTLPFKKNGTCFFLNAHVFETVISDHACFCDKAGNIDYQ